LLFVTIVCLLLAALLTFLVITAGNKKERLEGISKVIIIALFFSILVNVSLAQNYTQSLVPEANDGIGISNWLAELIITDDGWGQHWSQELFLKFYRYSTNITIFLLVLYMGVLIATRVTRK